MNGHCEYQHLNIATWPAELVNTVFGLLTAILGVFGLHTSRNITVGTRYMFCLIFGYGITAAAHTTTLWNGFSKISGGILSLMQSICVVRLMSALGYIHKDLNNFSTAVMTLFGLYPLVAIVLGSSFDNPWVGWLSFDLIWAVVVLPLVVVLLFLRNHDLYPVQFHLIWKTVGFCVVGYGFWLLDTFQCNKQVALFGCYGLWLLCMGFTFYYLTIIDAIIQGYHQKFEVVLHRWPKKWFVIFVFVTWETIVQETVS